MPPTECRLAQHLLGVGVNDGDVGELAAVSAAVHIAFVDIDIGQVPAWVLQQRIRCPCTGCWFAQCDAMWTVSRAGECARPGSLASLNK